MGFVGSLMKAFPALYWRFFLSGSFNDLFLLIFLPTITAWKVSKYRVFLVRIFLYSDWIRRFSKSPYSVRIQENKDQKNSVFRHFSRSAFLMLEKLRQMIRLTLPAFWLTPFLWLLFLKEKVVFYHCEKCLVSPLIDLIKNSMIKKAIGNLGIGTSASVSALKYKHCLIHNWNSL